MKVAQKKYNKNFIVLSSLAAYAVIVRSRVLLCLCSYLMDAAWLSCMGK